MSFRKLIISPEGMTYYGFATTKLNSLVEQRKSLGLIMMQRHYFIEDFLIKVFTSEWDAYILIVKLASGVIVLAGSPSQVQLSTYDYLADSLTETVPSTSTEGTLHAQFNNKTHYNNKQNIAGRSVTDLPYSGGQSILNHAYENEYVQNGLLLQMRAKDDYLHIVATLAGTGWTPEYSISQGDFIILPRFKSNVWNLNSVLSMWAFAPHTRNVLPVFQWTPGVFFAEPGNGIYGTGWQYGKFLQSWVEPPDGYALNYAEIKFTGFMDSRNQQSAKPYGYSEVVTKFDDEDKFLISFFLSTSIPGMEANPTWVQQNISGTKMGGTSMIGKEPTFRIDAFADMGISADPDVSFWNSIYEPEGSEAAPTIDNYGIVASQGSKAVLYRYNGALTTAFTSVAYHSHAVSASGRYVALFEGEEFINRIIVYDLQSNTQLQDSVVVADAQALSGAWAIDNASGFEPLDLAYLAGDYSATTMVDEDIYKERAHYGSVVYPEGDNAPTSSRKITCEDGVHAVVGIYSDPCFEMTLTKIEPTSAPPSGAVSVTIDGETFNANVFQDLTQSLPYILFSSAGPPPTPYEIVVGHWKYNQAGDPITEELSVSGTNVRVSTIERKDMSLYQDIYNKVHVSNALGTVSRSGFDEDGNITVVSDCASVDVSASSSCGQSASLEVANATPAELIIGYTGVLGNDDQFATGGFIGASGGVSPYTYSASQGSVDADTGEVLDASGSCGEVTITVVDHCGESNSMDLQGLTGAWHRVWYNYIRFDLGCTIGSSRITFGSTRYGSGCRASSTGAAKKYLDANCSQSGTCPLNCNQAWTYNPATTGSDIPVSDGGKCTGFGIRCQIEERFVCC